MKEAVSMCWVILATGCVGGQTWLTRKEHKSFASVVNCACVCVFIDGFSMYVHVCVCVFRAIGYVSAQRQSPNCCFLAKAHASSADNASVAATGRANG